MKHVFKNFDYPTYPNIYEIPRPEAYSVDAKVNDNEDRIIESWSIHNTGKLLKN
jgi:hypothetical protein